MTNLSTIKNTTNLSGILNGDGTNITATTLKTINGISVLGSGDILSIFPNGSSNGPSRQNRIYTTVGTTNYVPAYNMNVCVFMIGGGGAGGGSSTTATAGGNTSALGLTAYGGGASGVGSSTSATIRCRCSTDRR